jgi:hypothetical protein
MSIKNLHAQLETLDEQIAALEDERVQLISRITGAGSRKRSLTNLIPFPTASGITVRDSTSTDWPLS